MWGIWRLGGCLEVFVAFIRSFLSRFCGISCLAGSVGEYIYVNICIYSTGYKMLNHNVYSIPMWIPVYISFLLVYVRFLSV